MADADPEPCEECDGRGWDVFTEFGSWRPDEGVLDIQRCDACFAFYSDVEVLALPEAQAALAKAHAEDPEILWGFTACVLAYIAYASVGEYAPRLPHVIPWDQLACATRYELALYRPGFQQADLLAAVEELKTRGLVTADEVTGVIRLTYDW